MRRLKGDNLSKEGPPPDGALLVRHSRPPQRLSLCAQACQVALQLSQLLGTRDAAQDRKLLAGSCLVDRVHLSISLLLILLHQRYHRSRRLLRCCWLGCRHLPPRRWRCCPRRRCCWLGRRRPRRRCCRLRRACRRGVGARGGELWGRAESRLRCSRLHGVQAVDAHGVGGALLGVDEDGGRG